MHTSRLPGTRELHVEKDEPLGGEEGALVTRRIRKRGKADGASLCTSVTTAKAHSRPKFVSRFQRQGRGGQSREGKGKVKEGWDGKEREREEKEKGNGKEKEKREYKVKEKGKGFWVKEVSSFQARETPFLSERMPVACISEPCSMHF